MKTVNRVKTYRKGNKWYADNIPVDDSSRLGSIEFLGIGQTYVYTYKNGNKETRWKIVESLGPKDKVWFMLKISIKNAIAPMLKLNMAVNIVNNKMTYEWLTLKEFKPSCDCNSSRILGTLEIARIESAIEKELSGE